MPGAYVNALAIAGEYLYVAGYFSVVGDDNNYALPANSIARYNLVTKSWETLGKGIEHYPGLPGIVNDLEVHENKIFVGGQFFFADEKYYENFAVLTDNKWSGIDKVDKTGINGFVKVVKVINSEIYIGGFLQLEESGPSYGILKWDGSSWVNCGESLLHETGYAIVYDIEPFKKGLIIAGSFYYPNNSNINNLGYFDGTEWSEIGGGLISAVSNVLVFENKILVSGAVEIFTNDGGFGLGLSQYNYDITKLDDTKNNPLSFNLSQNYPNPFNPLTNIKYSISQKSHVAIRLFDSLGRLVTILVDDEKLPGNYSITLNAADLSSGIYFYQMQTEQFKETKKLVLQK